MWLVSLTMTVTGKSDKEIKSMAFTPCSFLLLFRKYFFMTTSVNGKLPQLKVLKIPLGVKTTLNPGIFSLLFPTKKEGYTPIAIKSWALFNRDGADNIHINGVVTDQNVSIEGKISGSNQIIIPSDAFVEVLYLVN